MHDHPVDAYSAAASMPVAETEIQTSQIGAILFSCGSNRCPRVKHTLTVKARRSPTLDSVVPTSAAEGFVDLHVRAA